MVGCLFALFALIWKITKLALKILWKILRVLLFRCGLIFIALFAIGALITEAACGVGFAPGGEMQAWYYAGLGLSIVLTAIVFVRNAVKDDKKKDRR